MDTIVQYLILRSDLKTVLKWPLGALIAQACHAATAVLHENSSDSITRQYLADIDRMHKVVLAIENDEKLRLLSEQLTQAGVLHKLWIEQPENVSTCIALKPYPKSDVFPYLQHLKLLK